MNGPEHYAEAERLAAKAGALPPEVMPLENRVAMMAAAQLHATLALVAATALPLEGVDLDGRPFVRGAAEAAWMNVAGVEL